MRRMIAALAGLALAVTLAVPVSADTATDNQTETQIGQQEYQQLAQKGEIIRQSPYYATLQPIADRIKRVADPQYYHPFTFILVHESQPNAFAVPGGNVYVTDSLMKFVENKEELAGVLCHETSHDIHHDVLNLYQKQQKVGRNYAIGDILVNVLTGGRAAGVVDQAANIGFSLQSLNFSRAVESNADHKGAETCAAAGFNPWGMVWLFQHFEKADTNGQMEMLSDHPTDEHRIEDLKREFATEPSLFGRFNPNIASATPLRVASTSNNPNTDSPRF